MAPPRHLAWRLVAVLQLLGAALLLYLILVMTRRAGLNWALAAVMLAFAVVVLGFLLSAIGLWRGNRRAAWWSLGLQLIQLPCIVTAPLTFYFAAPALAGLTAHPAAGLHWHTHWRPTLEITLDGDPSLPGVGVNLLALTAIVLLAYGLRRKPALPAG